MHEPHRKQYCCQNCQRLLEQEENFCPRCGQQNTTRVASFKTLVYEVVEDTFAWDSRWFRTVVPFLFQPGRLTNEFLAGRRVSYMPPLRLYFFVSLVCFSVIAIYTAGDDRNDKRREEAKKQLQADSIKNDILTALPPGLPPAQRRKIDRALSKMTLAESRKGLINTGNKDREDFAKGFEDDFKDGMADADSGKIRPGTSADMEPGISVKRRVAKPMTKQSRLEKSIEDTVSNKVIGKVDEWTKLTRLVKNPVLTDKQILDSLHWEDNTWNRMKVNKLARFNESSQEEFVAEMWDNAPLFMFILLPMMALMMKLLYVRRKRLYIEHLIFMLHVHAFIFFLIALDIVFSNEFSDSASAFFVPLIFIYVWLAFYKVYRQGWFRTSFKLFSFLILYAFGFTLFAVFGLLALAAIY